jgi:hypothetical protein
MIPIFKSKSPNSMPLKVIAPIRTPNPKTGSPRIRTKRPKVLYFIIRFLLNFRVMLGLEV